MWKKLSLYWKCIVVMVGMIVVLNLAALSREFCDWYVEYIFPIWVTTYGRVSGWFPFSLGELMIFIGIIMLITAIVCGILLLPLGSRQGYKRWVKKFYKVCLAVLITLGVLLSANFTILYHCSPMEVNPDAEKRAYSVEELELLRNYLVEQSNGLSGRIERDEKSCAVYAGDMQKETKRAMHNLAEENHRLSGFYPNAKPVTCSRFMSLTHIAGVYFAFSLEANYNNEMYSSVYPETICHEYAHLKGYILEDEANFIGYLACMKSDDIFFRYSGYLGALDNVEKAYKNSVSKERYRGQPQLNELAYGDYSVWLSEKAREEIYNSNNNMPKVSEELTRVRKEVHDTSLKIYGVKDGIASYDRVTELLLEYYDGQLY